MLGREGVFWTAGFEAAGEVDVRLWGVRTTSRHGGPPERGWASVPYPGADGAAAICLVPKGSRTPVGLRAPEQRVQNAAAFHECRQRVADVSIGTVFADEPGDKGEAP